VVFHTFDVMSSMNKLSWPLVEWKFFKIHLSVFHIATMILLLLWSYLDFYSLWVVSYKLLNKIDFPPFWHVESDSQCILAFGWVEVNYNGCIYIFCSIAILPGYYFLGLFKNSWKRMVSHSLLWWFHSQKHFFGKVKVLHNTFFL